MSLSASESSFTARAPKTVRRDPLGDPNPYLDPNIYLPPLPSLAVRKVARRSKRSMPSSFVNPTTGRIVVCEADLEFCTALTTICRPEVYDIVGQGAEVTYLDELGKARTHVFDFHVAYRDGTSDLTMVKPRAKAIEQRLDLLRDRIARFVPRSLATGVCIKTEASFTRTELLNAEKLVRASFLDPLRLEADVVSYTVDANQPVSISEICENLEGIEDTFWPVLRCIASGRLRCASNGEITRHTLVVPSGWRGDL